MWVFLWEFLDNQWKMRRLATLMLLAPRRFLMLLGKYPLHSALRALACRLILLVVHS